MLLFQPAALDKAALSDLGTASGDGVVYYWLVDTPFATLKRGRRVEHAQLAALLRDGRQYA